MLLEGEGGKGRLLIAQLLNKIAGQITVQEQAQCLRDLKPALVYLT